MPKSLLADAQDKFRAALDASLHNRQAYRDDFEFARLSKQWPDELVKQRKREGRPHLVTNKLPALIRAVVNESRQNTPGINVSPADSDADEDTAQVISGIVRAIERNSAAEVAYDTAIDQAVTGGFGFFRIEIDYTHANSFELELRIHRIPNALQVYWDPASTAFDASDWEFAFVVDTLARAAYRRRFPNHAEVSFSAVFDSNTADRTPRAGDAIQIAEYWRKEETAHTLLQIAVPNAQGGETIRNLRADQLATAAREFFAAGGFAVAGSDATQISEYFRITGATERRRRTVYVPAVTRFVLNDQEILEEREWPGPDIPICPVWGDEVYLNGKRYFGSLVRDAKDAQKMHNFWRSASTELVALAPKAPWVGPEGFVPRGQEAKWATANTCSHAYLEYNPAAGAPTRQQFAGPPTGALREAVSASEDMQVITGVYPSAIGARSNETSGRAIIARERQGDVTNFHFIDNLSRAIQYAGRVLVGLIPAVYSQRSVVRILGEGQAESVAHLVPAAGSGTLEQPGERAYDLTLGQYDVTISAGPSFATQRETARETLLELMRHVPDAAPIIGDLFLEHMDFVGADRVAKRLRALLPPAIQQLEKAGDDNAEDAAVQLAQLTGQLQQMQAAVQEGQTALAALQAENKQLKTRHDLELTRLNNDFQLRTQSLELQRQDLALKTAQSQTQQMIDILPRLKSGDSYGAHSGSMLERVASVGSCCCRPYCTAHFTGEPGVSRP